ncbi:MAG: hypothetical protein AAB726_02600 [Patescibacteria group bacterium]
MNNQPDLLLKAEDGLKKVYDQYEKIGLLAVYIWGSVLTEDFNPEKSDVDSIGIVEKSFPIEKELEIATLLKKSSPEVKDLKMRLVYLDELNGSKSRGYLARHIAPTLLLHDFEYWHHVAGKKYKRSDFKLKNISSKQAVGLKLKEIYDRHILEIKKNDTYYVYFLKALARLVSFSQQEKAGEIWRFSYASLRAHASSEDKEIVENILKIRRNNWDKDEFQKSLPIFLEFIDNQRTDVQKTIHDVKIGKNIVGPFYSVKEMDDYLDN